MRINESRRIERRTGCLAFVFAKTSYQFGFLQFEHLEEWRYNPWENFVDVRAVMWMPVHGVESQSEIANAEKARYGIRVNSERNSYYQQIQLW